jgi:hypothetical protein
MEAMMDKEISIAALEQELADEEAFDEIEGADTEEIAVPRVIDEEERVTAPYEIAKPQLATWLHGVGDVYWVPLAS